MMRPARRRVCRAIAGCAAFGCGAVSVRCEAASDAAENKPAARLASTVFRFDVSGIAPGEWRDVKIGPRKVTIRHVSAEDLERAGAGGRTPASSRKWPPTSPPTWIVAERICPHAGCVVLSGLGPFKGWLCGCHGSVFDPLGRVRAGPAKTGLTLLPYSIDGDLICIENDD